MIKRIQLPIARPLSVACLIVVGTGFAGTTAAADRNPESPAEEVAVADGSAGGCLLFLDYLEWDFIFFQRYHMVDHGIGWGDPAETEEPRGEWLLRDVVLREREPHTLMRGYTRNHTVHVECSDDWLN